MERLLIKTRSLGYAKRKNRGRLPELTLHHAPDKPVDKGKAATHEQGPGGPQLAGWRWGHGVYLFNIRRRLVPVYF